MDAKPELNFLDLKGLPIFKQLQLEEALLRADTENWCLINTGAPVAIVMGVSTQPEKVVNEKVFNDNPVPLIRRYSGGGTVIIEESTVLLSLILNHSHVPATPFPREVMAWTHKLYRPAFGSLPFKLEENDYVLGERKCGGNAQYFIKNRLVHHTSFLWDYTPSNMDYLCMPPRMPAYRNQRGHGEFLETIKTHIPEKTLFIKCLIEAMGVSFDLKQVSLETARQALMLPYRQATRECSLELIS